MRIIEPFRVSFVLALFLSGCSSALKAPISFENNSGWIWSEANAEYLEVIDGVPTGCRLEMDQHYPDRRGEAANSMLRWENLPEQFSGKDCYGRFGLYERDDRKPNSTIAIFMMQVGKTLWIGTYRGSMESWKHALIFLKSAKSVR